MPEEQNVWGGEWNTRFNRFLIQVMRWKQLGQSNTDVYCERLKRKVGLDSVFTYKRNPNANQQIVFVEAKSALKMDYLDRSKLQKWVEDLITKINNAPYTPDFHEKFNPEASAQSNLGLISLWVREHETYAPESLQEWLSQLRIPQQRTAINICFISNQIISRFCMLHDEIGRLQSSGIYKEVRFFFPNYGTLPAANGSCIPIESLLSKFVFCHVTKVQSLKGKDQVNEYPADVIFYFGKVDDYHDLRFIELAVKQFQLGEARETYSREIEIYTLYDPTTLRNEIENFKRDFGSPNNIEYEFKRFAVGRELPGWMEQDD